MTFNYQTITNTSRAAISAVIPQYETVLIENLQAILDRYERDPEYHFIDTKLNIITGQNFYPAAAGEEFKSKTVIYSWIQGRGIEALTGHAQWLPSCSIIDEAEKTQLITRIKKLLSEVVTAMEECRAANNRQLFFWMRQNGQNLTTNANSQLIDCNTIPPQSNYSDLFYAKGLLTASNYLNMPVKFAEAELYLKKVIEDIQNSNFISDQQPFDIKNRVAPVAGKNIQGPWMIALGGIALGIEYGEQEYWTAKAEQFISHIIDVHINTNDNDHCQRYDFWEAVDNSGKPWVEDNGTIICDPGHALEFIGLSLKCLLKIEKLNANVQDTENCSLRSASASYELLEKCRTHYPALLKHFFALGFNPQAAGICKAYDLKSRNVINSDMPWWSLPETIRAATLLTKFSSEAETEAMRVISDASNAFMNKFINPEVHLMAWQTRNIAGNPIELIPATPDADPGYHTGLSIIDFIKTWQEN
ncbi:MAG: AGE family epimerase/isomerase [Victivallaceae bacterium]|nr:AGE family epimerase/isomerase [Victivallaceae bacterium]